MKKQTKTQSLIESLTNITIWYITALISQIIIFPLFNIEVSILDNLLIGFFFTVISLVRSYSVRRYFNNRI